MPTPTVGVSSRVDEANGKAGKNFFYSHDIIRICLRSPAFGFELPPSECQVSEQHQRKAMPGLWTPDGQVDPLA